MSDYMTITDPYKFTDLGLGVYLIETQAFEDHRGYFMEGYNKDEFAKHGIMASSSLIANIELAKPLGTNITFLSSAEYVAVTTCPKVADPLLTSTHASNILPCKHLNLTPKTIKT